MNILSVFSIVRDEEFYIDMALKSIIDRSCGVYVMDTGSCDNTIEILEGFRHDYPDKIMLEQKGFGGKYRFDNGPFVKGKPPTGFNEAAARNYGFERAKEIFPDYDWILSMDGDEIVTDKMFDEIERAYSLDAMQLGHGALCPLTPETYINKSSDYQAIKDTIPPDEKVYSLLDPHSTAWSKYLPDVSWYFWGMGYHIGHKTSDIRRLVTAEEVKIHLHYSFGPKAIHGWICEWTNTPFLFADSIGMPRELCEKQEAYEERYPDWFVDGKFKPKKEVLKKALSMSSPLKTPLPDYVLKKWNDWGDWKIED